MKATCFGGPFDGLEVLVPDDLEVGGEFQLGGDPQEGNPISAYDLTEPGRLSFFGYHAVTGPVAESQLETHVAQLAPILRRMDEACKRGLLIPPPIACAGWELRRVRR